MNNADIVRRIVIPVGGADREYLAQEEAVQWAATLEVPLHAFHVSAEPDQVQDPFSYIEGLAKRRDVELHTQILVGSDPAKEILAELDALDLTIIGSENLDGTYQLGSVARTLFQSGPGPLHVVRLT